MPSASVKGSCFFFVLSKHRKSQKQYSLDKISICSLFLSFNSSLGRPVHLKSSCCWLKKNYVLKLKMFFFCFRFVCILCICARLLGWSPWCQQSNSTCSTHLSPAFLLLTPVLIQQCMHRFVCFPSCKTDIFSTYMRRRWESYLPRIYSILMNYRETRLADKAGMVMCLLVVLW